MKFSGEFPGAGSYYDLLEIRTDTSIENIREAYQRVKATYGHDNVATYSLLNADDSKEALTRIEEAYATLSHPEKRKAYDLKQGIIRTETWSSDPQSKVISIDRVPPMEREATEDLLIPPATDLTPHLQAQSGIDPIHLEIDRETEWAGSFLKRVRETKRISIEEICNVTRVSKTYIRAIEDENYGKLPAAVFIRGFVTQIAKTLKLPPDKVVSAYMARFAKSGFDKSRS